MKNRDEAYIIDLCDRVLNLTAKRQHRFDFLRGDSGARLPVDAFYEELKLAIEYRETQHTAPVSFFDKRMTCSGVNRAEQRQRYDQQRRDMLPKNGIRLVELDYSLFTHTGQGRLKRDTAIDEAVIRAKLTPMCS